MPDTIFYDLWLEIGQLLATRLQLAGFDADSLMRAIAVLRARANQVEVIVGAIRALRDDAASPVTVAQAIDALRNHADGTEAIAEAAITLRDVLPEAPVTLPIRRNNGG